MHFRLFAAIPILSYPFPSVRAHSHAFPSIRSHCHEIVAIPIDSFRFSSIGIAANELFPVVSTHFVTR
jgi:hypothetical protein